MVGDKIVKDLEECARGLFDVISWYLMDGLRKTNKQMVDTLVEIPAQI
jgi:hypothetical protein